MTRKSGALAGLAALAALALSGVALGLAGDDRPFVPPSVELGSPVTVAPAVTAEGDRPAERSDPVEGDRPVERREPADASAPAVEPRAVPAPGAAEPPRPLPVADDRAGSSVVRPDGATVVSPVPVRLDGDQALPTVTDAIPTRSPSISPDPDADRADTAVPVATMLPATDDAPTVPEAPTHGGGSGPAPLHLATHTSCARPGASGLAEAGQRTEGTPASPPPQGNGPGCVPSAGGGRDDPRDRSRDDHRDGHELQAVREQDDRRDPGRNRAGAGRGRRGAGGR